MSFIYCYPYQCPLLLWGMLHLPTVWADGGAVHRSLSQTSNCYKLELQSVDIKLTQRWSVSKVGHPISLCKVCRTSFTAHYCHREQLLHSTDRYLGGCGTLPAFLPPPNNQAPSDRRLFTRLLSLLSGEISGFSENRKLNEWVNECMNEW